MIFFYKINHFKYETFKDETVWSTYMLFIIKRVTQFRISGTMKVCYA